MQILGICVIINNVRSFYRQRIQQNARVAQLVEYDLAKVGVAGSSPVSRSFYFQNTDSCFGDLYFFHFTGNEKRSGKSAAGVEGGRSGRNAGVCFGIDCKECVQVVQ